MIQTRRIFKDRNTNRSELRQLLETIFIAEIMYPSEELWMVFPWISDVLILDNRTGAFNQIMPHWPKEQIRLSEILFELIKRGCSLRLVTRPGQAQTEMFLANLSVKVSGLNQKNISVSYTENEHIKGMLGDNFYLNGSMNLTYNGIEMLREEIVFTLVQEEIETARFHLNVFNPQWENL